MVFFKKWVRNHQKFLLHFLIHIDVNMLCRKFELIPTSIFRVIATLRNEPKSEKIPKAIAHGFSKKWLRNHEKNLLHFLIHIDVNMLCSKFELILTTIFRVIAILRISQNLKSTQGYSSWFFPKNCSEITPNFYYIF